jgi:transposase InsO family protein
VGREEAAQGAVANDPVAELPKVRTIARILERAGEIAKRAPSSEVQAPTSAPKVDVSAPNDPWTVDFKGHWRTRNGSRAEPLTVRDACSRFVLAARLLESNDHIEVRHVFLQLFQRHGMPAAIQVDNGTPFISMRSPGGFTKLSAWWVSLGIRVIRGRPGHPQDNGGHERMHLDMRFDVEDVPEGDREAQQLAIDVWMAEFNHVRPHESLDMATPAELYRKSTRRYIGPRRAWYPSDYTPRSVTSKGYVKFGGRPFYVGMAFTGQVVAVRGRDNDTVEVLFYEVPLGSFRTAA